MNHEFLCKGNVFSAIEMKTKFSNRTIISCGNSDTEDKLLVAL